MAKQKASEERKKTLKAWVYKFFVEVWDRKFTPPSDVQSKLLNYLVRDNVSDSELEEIWASTKAWVKHYRVKAAAGEFVKLPCASVWYNEHQYDNPVPSMVETKQASELGICNVTHCPNEVIGERFSKCVDHQGQKQDKHLKEGYERMKKNGLGLNSGVSKSEWSQQCRKWLKESGMAGILSPQIRKNL